MNTSPHANRRDSITYFFIAAVIAVIVIGSFSCTKESPLDKEKEHGKWDVREDVNRMVYQDSLTYNVQ